MVEVYQEDKEEDISKKERKKERRRRRELALKRESQSVASGDDVLPGIAWQAFLPVGS